ncbi:MAG: hypothetical protein JNL01_11635 [Bdellovibrionales bacterium]|nr:hypothetical protein [Bdellovibrionales bacterium]
MKPVIENFVVPIKSDQLPATSLYLSWDWSKPSTSNRERLFDLIKQARALLKEELDGPVLQTYLEPIFNVTAKIKDPLPDLAGLAVFRTRDSFWWVQMTEDPGSFVVVADSFHIKPLLAYQQNLQRTAVLWFHESGATLAFGSDRQLVCHDTVIAPMKTRKNSEFFYEVKQMLETGIRDRQTRVVLAGDENAIRFAKKAKLHPNIIEETLSGFISKLALGQLELRFKDWLHRQKRNREVLLMNQLLTELKWNGFRTETDIEKIANLAVQGQIKTLVVSKDQRFFGKLNRKSGKIIFHGNQRDTRDDDLYDDLSEAVAGKGGEVWVVSKKLIPGNTGILAVIEPSVEFQKVS